MTLFLLKRCGEGWKENDLFNHLLIPDLAKDSLNGPLDDAALLANMWRLRRTRPYIVAFLGEVKPSRYLTDEDIRYVESLEVRQIKGIENSKPLHYVGVGDVSPFIPRTEDDFLFLFPDIPPNILPQWPLVITQLDAIYITRSDEFINIKTVDPKIVELIQQLPMWSERETNK